MRYCIAINFTWYGWLPKIKIWHGKGFAGTWMNEANKSALIERNADAVGGAR